MGSIANDDEKETFKCQHGERSMFQGDILKTQHSLSAWMFDTGISLVRIKMPLDSDGSSVCCFDSIKLVFMTPLRCLVQGITVKRNLSVGNEDPADAYMRDSSQRSSRLTYVDRKWPPGLPWWAEKSNRASPKKHFNTCQPQLLPYGDFVLRLGTTISGTSVKSRMWAAR